MASYAVAASLFVVGTSYLIQFVIEPPGTSTAGLQALDLRTQGYLAMQTLLGTPGVPGAWADPGMVEAAQRLGILEAGSNVRIDPEKFDALARGKYTGASGENDAVDYAEAKRMLGLEGYDFHLRAFPLSTAIASGAYGIEDMEDFRVAYVGDISGSTWSTHAQNEVDALENLEIGFDPATRSSDPTGDVYQDDSNTLRDHLLPNLGTSIPQSVLSQGSPNSKHDFWRVDAERYQSFLPGATGLSSALALAQADTGPLGYSKNREIRAILGSVDLSAEASGELATISWSDWVDTDRGNGTYDCSDHGWLEVSPDGGATWVKLTDTATARAQDCGTPPGTPRAPVMLAQTVRLRADQPLPTDPPACAACASNPEVLVALHWVADNDNNIGYGWVVDDVVVTRSSDGGAAMRKTFEGAEYDLLILGSDVDHNALTPNEVKNAIRDYVEIHGGRLLVLGGQQNVQWLDRLFDAGIGGASGGTSNPDESHPLLTVPNALNYDEYAPGTPWDFSASDDADLFSMVMGPDADHHTLTVSRKGAFGSDNEGTVILTSFRPGQWGIEEESRFFANAIVYGRYHYLFLEVGPPVPDSEMVASVARTATMNKMRDGTIDYVELGFIFYVWPGASVEGSLTSTLSTPLPVRDLEAGAADGRVWVNATEPTSWGTGTKKEWEVWRGTSPDTTVLHATIPYVANTPLGFYETSVTNGVTYWYTVVAVSSEGRGTREVPVSVSPRALPGAPVGVTATPSTTTITVSWTPPSATGPGILYGYQIHGRSAADPDYALLSEVGNVTSYVHTPADQNEWTYKVTALNGLGWGPLSSASGPAARLLPASAPDTFNVTNATAHQLTLTWAAPTDLAGGTLQGYRIQRSEDGNDWYELAYVNSPFNVSFADREIADGSTHWYKVQAVTNHGDGLASSAHVMTAARLPTAPTGLHRTGGISGQTTSFAWDAPDDGGSAITAYDIYRGPPAAMVWVGSTPLTSYTDAYGGNDHYKIRANNSVGSGPFSPAIQLNTGAASPTLTVTNATPHTLALSWTIPADLGPEGAVITHYDIERSVDGGTTWAPRHSTSTPTTAWTDDAVGDNATYTYRVRAVTNFGDGSFSPAVSRTTAGLPWAVNGLARTGGVTGVSTSIGWTAPSDGGSAIVNYDIYAGTTAGSETSVGVSTTTSFTHAAQSGLWYKVRANNALGSGGWSDSVQALAPPAAPTLTLSNSTPGQIALSWTTPDMGGGTFTEYRIHRSLDAGTTWSQLASTTNQTTAWVDANVQANASYSYRVQAVAGSLVGENSAAPTRQVQGAPWTVTGLARVGGTTGVSTQMGWDVPNSGGSPILNYEIWRNKSGEPLAPYDTAATNSYTDVGQQQELHWYQVRAVNAVGSGPLSDAVLALSPAAAPVLSLSNATIGQVTLSWTTPNLGGGDFVEYRIERSPDGSTWAHLGTNANSLNNTWADREVASNTTYHYRVQAVTTIGEGPILGAYSTPASKPTKGVPWAVSGVAYLSDTDGTTTIVWNVPSNGGSSILEYEVWRGAQSGSEARVGTSPTASYTDTTAPGAWYIVRAINGVGEGPWSPSTQALGLPGTPLLLTVGNATPHRLDLSWNAPASDGGAAITSYRVHRSLDGNNWQQLGTTGSNGTWLDLAVTDNTTYHYRVQAVNSVGAGSNTDTVAKATLSAPWHPLNLRKVSSLPSVQIVMAWDAPASNGGAGITQYEIWRDGSQYGTSSTTTFIDSDPETAARQYKVRAYNGVDWGPFSSTVTMVAT